MRKKYYKDDYEDDPLRGIITLIVVTYFIYLLIQFNIDRANFWRWSIYGFLFLVGLLILIRGFYRFKDNLREKHINRLLQQVREKGQEEYIKNFINRFGFEGKKGKSWPFRNHFIEWDRINDLEGILIEKGIKLKRDEGKRDVFILLKHYIQEKEVNLTRESIKQEPRKFIRLSGSDFEKLINRLYTAKGYTVELIGRSGDQGGDLIANKDGERILIQTKCYRDWSTGNAAVQQVVGAMKLYDCQKTIVITTSYFTPEAISLARANNTLLISKENLQKMLIDSLGESWR
ncbi:MAG: restriction endonuclease [bacterium]|nr:restriction endonuclease [bacterium]